MLIPSAVCSLLIMVASPKAQNISELHLLSEHYKPAAQSPSSFEMEAQSKFGIITTAFYIYKTFISSQDHMSCVFTPSCSEFALQAIQKQGLIVGSMNTFDRLIRCNGLRPHDYVIDPRLQRLVDPVRNVRYEEP
jgi:uncharacterized protein